jgi:multidrug efflux pump subunit AcrA (membrane-fusion protein)
MKITKHSQKSLKLLKPIPSSTATVIFFIISLILSFLFLIITPWQQTASGSGRVIAYFASERQQTINALIDGRLGKWFVQEGSIVKKGDKIVEIYDNDPSILQNLRNERSALITRYEAAEKATDFANINIQRQQQLFDKGISSKRTVELANIDHLKLKSDAANIQSEISRIDVRLARQANQIITAPQSGMILRRNHGEGAVTVKMGDILAELVPDTQSRAVELLIAGNDIPLIHIGQEVRLQFEGWPAVQFSGWPSIAVGTFGGIVKVVDSADNGNGQFRILVVPETNHPWPDTRYLRQGVKAHGWVILSTVTLGYELWRQFNGFPPSQSQGEPK